MKVGDYVRTRDGIILKVKDIKDIYTTDNIYIGMSIYDNEGHFVNDAEIIKSSPNIINLIEVKDIIKFQCISDEYDFEYKEQYINQINNNDDLESFKEAVENEDLKLISIATKEQFESCMYKVGE